MLMNKLMKDLLDTVDQEKMNDNGLIRIEEIISKTKLIGACVLYDCDGTLTEEAIDLKWALQVNGDYTGYEVSCNEIRIATEDVPISQIVSFTNELDKSLCHYYRGTKFGVIMMVEQFDIMLRFHTFREGEGLWLNEDLDQYDAPLLYST